MTDKTAKLDEMRKRFGLAESAMTENRKEALYDLKFVKGEQWDEEVKSSQGNNIKLTINRAAATVKNVVNEFKQGRPAVRVRPVDSNADKETANVIEGLIRNIESQSNAEHVYDWGVECAVTSGYGYWRVVPEYVDENSFDQDLRVRRVRNPFDVLFDPKSEDALHEDARYAFVHKIRDKARLQKKYKNIDLSGWGVATGSNAGWWSEEDIRVCEYFYKTKASKIIAQLDNGEVITIPEILDGQKIDPEEYAALYAQENGLSVVRRRISSYDQVNWCLATANEVLDDKPWKGRYIPIIPIIGDEMDIEGKRYLSGLVRPMRDPCRMYNYWMSKATQKVALSPMAKLLVTADQIKGHETHWNNINTDPKPYVPYNAVNGQAPPSAEFRPAQMDSGMANLIMMSSDQIKEVSGIFDASLGQRSNETSGIAIRQRQAQGGNANFHFTDNANRSIGLTGKILVDLIPHYYDTPRAARILGEDGTSMPVQLNEKTQNSEGEEVMYDVTTGIYDVVTESGASFATKRQESFDYMLQLTQANPNLFGVIGDLMFKNSDLPNADEIAERLAQAMGGQGDADPNQQPQMQQEIPQ